MATLTGSSIASTYTMLLKMDATGVTSSLQKIEDGDATDSALSVSTVAAALDATDKFYFDGGSDTYIFESGADVLDIFVGGANMIKLTESTTDTVLITGDLTVGADGTGHDVIFYSGTAGDNFTWDASAEKLTITGTNGQTALDIADGNLVVADNIDLAGYIDVDGTLEADAITVAGTALDEYIADTIGAMVGSNTETGIAVTYEDGDNTLDFVLGSSQTTVTSLLATDIKIGEDDQTKIDFETANEIHFYADNAQRLNLDANSRISLSNNTGFDSGTDNTVFGFLAGAAGLSGGQDNVLIGDYAGNAMTGGDYNVAIGADAMKLAVNCEQNVAIGYGVLDAADGTEEQNVAIGTHAMGAVDEGGGNANLNVAIGAGAMTGGTSTTLLGNIAIGADALNATGGHDQTGTIAIGNDALGALESGAGNVAVGYQASARMTTAAQSTAIGYQAMNGHLDGNKNTAIGYRAMYDTDGGGGGSSESSADNVFIGWTSGGGTWADALSQSNVAVGNSSMMGALNACNDNVSLGSYTLQSMTGGSYNTALGYNAGQANLTGDSNVFIGHNAGDGTTDVDNTVIIGAGAGSVVMTGSGGADGTVAIGKDSLAALTSGAQNTAIGFTAADLITTGNFNTIIGYEAFTSAATDDAGNTAVGAQALYSQNGSGTTANTAIGTEASLNNVTGTNNTYVGYRAGKGGTGSNSDNTAIGKDALLSITTAGNNVVIGTAAGDAITTGGNHVLIGVGAGGNFADDTDNVFIGYGCGSGAINGADKCVAIGSSAFGGAATQDGTVAIGYQALDALTSGGQSTAIGYQALAAQTTGGTNTAVGYQALGDLNHANANSNVAIGTWSGNTGTNDLVNANTNTFVGYSTAGASASAVNQTVIGGGTTGQADNSVTLGNASVTAVYMSQDADAQVNCGTVNIDVAQSTGAIIIDNDTAGKGGIHFKDGGASKGLVGLTGVITGDSSEDIGLFSESGAGVSFMVNGGGTRVVYIDSNGAMVKTSQPAFLVQPASDQDDITNSVSTTIVFGTEIFDQGADFASNTFTAPVTGRYQLQFQLQCQELDNAATYFKVELETSNRNITVYENIEDSDIVVRTIGTAILADMDANDTVSLVLYQVGGNNQMDIKSGASFFSGYLVC